VYNITKWHSQFKFSTLIGSVQNLALASIWKSSSSSFLHLGPCMSLQY
jgi:hypothetical protein